MNVWNEFLLYVYGGPPAIVLVVALLAKGYALWSGRKMSWSRAVGIGLIGLLVCFAGLVVYAFGMAD